MTRDGFTDADVPIDEPIGEAIAPELPAARLGDANPADDDRHTHQSRRDAPGEIRMKEKRLHEVGTRSPEVPPQPIDERLDTPEGVIVLAQLPQREVPRFAPYLVAEPAASAKALARMIG